MSRYEVNPGTRQRGNGGPALSGGAWDIHAGAMHIPPRASPQALERHPGPCIYCIFYIYTFLYCGF